QNAGDRQVNRMQPFAPWLLATVALERWLKHPTKTAIQEVSNNKKGCLPGSLFRNPCVYNVDSISKPQASKRGSGMYFEFLLRRAHSRRRVERTYWSGVSLNSFTACSNDVTTGITGPIGSGLPQLGLPRLLAIMN